MINCVKVLRKIHKNSSLITLIVYDLLPFLIKKRKSSLGVKTFPVSTKIRGQIFIHIGGNLIKHNSLKNLGDNWQKIDWSIVHN